MQPFGKKIRRARLRLALTLAELAERAGVSKAYLSLIENDRVTNPPSDEKLQRIEQALDMGDGELVGQAQVRRMPSDIRAVLERLIRQGSRTTNLGDAMPSAESRKSAGPLNLDDAYLSGVLQELADRNGGNVEVIAGQLAAARIGGTLSSVVATVPVVNKVSAGYPSDFTDLSYPPRVADQYIAAPGVEDPDAFAARVSGDSMSPKYVEGDVVIFSPLAAWKEGADCFVRFEDGQTTFKRVFVESGEEGSEMLRLQARNERYPPRLVARELVAGVYKAVYVYRGVD